MTSTGRVLVVDDDRPMVELMLETLAAVGHQVIGAHSGESALATLRTHAFDVVLTDLRMHGMSGLQLCAEIQAAHPDLPVIVLTGFGSMSAAVEAMRAGAYDFLSKPVELEQVELSVARALQHRRLTHEVEQLRRATPRSRDIIGESPAMRGVFDILPRAARADAPVLITGETGTGKELIARALHRGSGHADAPFVAINCAALPEALLESELFGHVRGAFTDARTDRRGLFLEAGEGTLLLDEIGELPLSLQPKLLRALQESRIRPVGSDKEIPTRCRVLAATNLDLRLEVQASRFRSDLYYRLAVVRLSVPPLRDRAGDILLLAQHFLERAATRTGRRVLGMTTPVTRTLMAYPWPGNVRELENCIEGAVALTEHDRLVLADFPREIREGFTTTPAPSPATSAGSSSSDSLEALAEVERRHILSVLEAVGGNKQDASRVLGIDRRTLYRKLDQYRQDEEEGSG